MLVVIVPVEVARIDKFKVTIESQPTEFTNVSKYVPADVKSIPLNKYD